MANYFPLYCNIEKRPILIFGGGSKAYEKISKLLPCGPALTVAAEKVTPTIKQFAEMKKITLHRSNGSDAQALISRLHPKLVIIADVDDDKIEGIFKICRKNGTEVNTVGKTEFSTVLFPAVIQRNNLSIAVSTFGKSPAAAKWVRDHIERSLPMAVEGITGHFDTLRKKLTEKIDFQPTQFSEIYQDILNTALSENRMLSAAEMADLVAKYVDEAE